MPEMNEKAIAALDAQTQALQALDASFHRDNEASLRAARASKRAAIVGVALLVLDTLGLGVIAWSALSTRQSKEQIRQTAVVFDCAVVQGQRIPAVTRTTPAKQAQATKFFDDCLKLNHVDPSTQIRVPR